MRLVEGYRAAAREAGREPQVIMMRDAWVARTGAEAEAVYGPEVMAAYRYYWQNRLAEFQDIPPDPESSDGPSARSRHRVDPNFCSSPPGGGHGSDYFLLRLRHGIRAAAAPMIMEASSCSSSRDSHCP